MTAACASNPPAPPLALNLADDRKEFPWPRFTWKPGVSLTYDVESHARIVSGEREESGTKRSVHRLTAVEKTAKGATRVELVADGTKIGDFLYDSQGVATDWILTDAATKKNWATFSLRSTLSESPRSFSLSGLRSMSRLG